MLQSLSIQLTVQLLRTQQDGQEEKRACQVSGVLSPEIRRSVEFIHAYYTDNLSLHQVAASASLSQYHFLRLFKRQIGLTPHAYIQRLRLQRAALLLSRSNETISEIASQLGFSSPGHFSDSFRRYYGLTPSQYRAR
jgi:AraC family transcriptional regulator